MKTLIIFLFCGCMLSANHLFAQKQKGKLLDVVTITAESNISEKVRDAFFSKFKNAQNMSWFQGNKNFLVKFIMEDQKHLASFRKNGYLNHHISYGEEKNLPSAVKMQVQSKYDQYNIGQVFNLEREGRNVWIVNLENQKYIIVASIENDVINEISRYKNYTAYTYPVISKTK